MDKKYLKYDCIDDLIVNLVEDYQVEKKPIEVSFRKLIPELKNIDKHTHLIHPYPAKLLVHIPYFFLNNNYFSKKGHTVLDPFCGTGTVLLESILFQRNAFGVDANPLAKLIAQVKTEKYNTLILNEELKKVIYRANRYKIYEIPDVVNKDYWFAKSTQESLAKLKRSIDAIRDEKTRNFFKVCFSNIVKKVSYADPRISVPVKLNPQKYSKGSHFYNEAKSRIEEVNNCDVFEKFRIICLENIERFKKTEIESINCNVKFISNDARHLHNGDLSDFSESVDLILTSPPYAGAQKYIRSSSLNIGWLGIAPANELRSLESLNIGRENYYRCELIRKSTGIRKADNLLNRIFKINRERFCIMSNYLFDMFEAFDEMYRVLKKNGYLIIIVGNNRVCNIEFESQAYFSEYLMNKGMKLELKLIDDIKSYGLMTKRNKTADIISREWILVFKKV